MILSVTVGSSARHRQRSARLIEGATALPRWMYSCQEPAWMAFPSPVRFLVDCCRWPVHHGLPNVALRWERFAL